MREVILSFKNSLQRLEEVLDEKPTDITRDAAIQRFEFTVELAWKSTQKFLRERGLACNSPKGCLQEAFKFGLIEDDPLWLRMVDDRNLTVHTYDEEVAVAVFNRLGAYLPLLGKLLEAIEKGM